jgi:hypothetical protein
MKPTIFTFYDIELSYSLLHLKVREASLRQQLESRGEIEALQNKATLASAEAEK